MSTNNSNWRRKISDFLDCPESKSEKSKVFISFYPTRDVRDVGAAISFLHDACPIPFLLRKRRKKKNTCVELESFSRPKIVFGYSTPSENPDNDLLGIMSWFKNNGIPVEVV